MVFWHWTGSVRLTGNQLERADVNGDGNLGTVDDVILIWTYMGYTEEAFWESLL